MLGLDPQVSSPQFIADFLVTHLKPDIKVITTKFGNVKFRARVMQLFAEDQTPDLLSFTRKAQMAVIDSIQTPLPSWFKKEEYLDRIQKSLHSYLQENSEISSAVKQVENRPNFDSIESAKVFRDAIIVLGDRMKDWYKAYEEYSSKLFLVSDISSSYFLLSKQAELSQIAAFDVYGRDIRVLDARLGFDRPEKFAYDAKLFRSKLSPLVGVGRVLSDSLARLNLYLDLANSSSMIEMFHLTPYLERRTDVKILDHYLQELEIALSDLNAELIAHKGLAKPLFPLSESTLALEKDLSNVILA